MTDGTNKGTAAQRLRDYVDDIEALIEERAKVNAKIKGKKAEAKADGFVVKAIGQIIKEKTDGKAVTNSWHVLMDVYRGAMGMLGADGLGGGARKSLDDPEDDPPPPGAEGEGASAPAADITRELDPEELDAARQDGADAALIDQKVTDNPHPAGDPRRGAWDEGWCGAVGGNGMEIPKAFQRTTPKKKKDGAADGDEDPA